MNFRELLKDYKKIVIKVGTTSLTRENGKVNIKAIEDLAFVISKIKEKGKNVVLVSSGAIAVGTEILNLNQRPRDTIGKQVASSVGQPALMQIYENSFSKYNNKIAQILLTRDIVESEEKFTNAKNTVLKLLEMGVVPIVNENDTVSTEELEFSDNDTLSAYVCNLVEGELLIIFSDIDGMYTKDPNKFSDAEIISEVNEITDEIRKSATGSASELGTGGMSTKINCAKMIMENNSSMIIASGEDFKILFDILNGEKIGTLFIN